ncbi:5-hydroxytryptamine receptor 3C-like [Chanos chanos]|uniref:5-hydroxytryptamine receptor 3C-like n=1 Tax=Chanos chanos TaxID=29144 RepID=A0A6J2WR36_CHACN|nr:5-hydroxytryptamine receptor 3C-like [Chanos chanos]
MTPPQNVDHSSFKMTLILGYTVFLLLMNDLLSVTGNNIPLINVFFSICLALMVTSLLETILITNVLCGSKNYSRLPHWVRVVFLKFLAQLDCSLGHILSCCQKALGEGRYRWHHDQVLKAVPDKICTGNQQSLYSSKIEGTDGVRTRDLRFTRPTPYHLATAPRTWMDVEWIVELESMTWELSVFMVSLCLSETLNCSEPTTQSLLAAFRESVFNTSEVRPVSNLHTPTNISLTFTLYGILGVDEKAQVLRTFVWLRLEWRMENVGWDPTECGTSVISLPRTKLWMPDIVINEFMDENKAPATYYVYVNSTGYVRDGRPFNVISSCNLDIYTFPFDIQNCTFTFNSYKHNVLDVQLEFGNTAEEILQISRNVMQTKGEWELIDIKAIKPKILSYDEHTWDSIIYYIALKRRATLYVVNLLIPSCFLLTVDLFSFLLPPQNVDRSSFKMTLILGYTVFLLLMNDLLPVTGNNIPLINVFFSICLALMVASLLETILITNVLCGSKNYSRLPHWVRVVFLKYLARLVCAAKDPSDQNPTAEVIENLEITSGSAKDDETGGAAGVKERTVSGLEQLKQMSNDITVIRHHVDQHFTNDPFTQEWIHLGQVIDRLLFSLYILFISVSFIVILIIWLYWYNA